MITLGAPENVLSITVLPLNLEHFNFIIFSKGVITFYHQTRGEVSLSSQWWNAAPTERFVVVPFRSGRE